MIRQAKPVQVEDAPCRINLNAAFAEEEPQTEEDRIAADMMSANGNTVDFTA